MPSNDKTIYCARLPDHLCQLIDGDARERGIARQDMMRLIIEGYYFNGTTSLQGADEGFVYGRSMAIKLTHVLLWKAITELPEDLEGAQALIDEYAEYRRQRAGLKR